SSFYTLSLHDALPIWCFAHPTFLNLQSRKHRRWRSAAKLGMSSSIPDRDRKMAPPKHHPWLHQYRLYTLSPFRCTLQEKEKYQLDRKSTRLNSSHVKI